MNKILPFLLVALLFSGCFWDRNPHGARPLGKDFRLSWSTDTVFQSILLCDEGENGDGGLVIVHDQVYEALGNGQYIIAKQHPDLEYETAMRLYGDTNARGDYELGRLADTLYLRPQDSLYRENGRWYWRPAGPWYPPEGLSLGIDTALTYYYIIDIRDYGRPGSMVWYNRKAEYIHVFENATDYLQGRRRLGLPDSLDFISRP